MTDDGISKSDDEWRRALTPEQFRVARCGGTELPFSGEYVDLKENGTFHCACCDVPLFSSGTKYDSGSGWPSFWEPVDENAVRTEIDLSHGMRRVEARCANCDAHLGHVFDDGPRPTGQRYCVNSASLSFETEEEA